MADEDEKTEEPTGKRKMDARKKGTVAKSQDFSAAIMARPDLYICLKRVS